MGQEQIHGAPEYKEGGGPVTQQPELVTTLTEQEKLVDILRHELARQKAEDEGTGLAFALPFKDQSAL